MSRRPTHSDMFFRLLGAIGCLCLLHPGLWAEECSQDVLAGRETVFAREGEPLSLSCVVQHCGRAWTGIWTRGNSKDNKITARHLLTNVSLSATQTRLTLTFPSVGLSDGGSYGCSVKWARGDTQEGHLKYVNVTAAVPPSERSVLHRVLVWAAASLCLPVVLCLARCLRSEVKPQPLPRTISAPAPRSPRPPPRCPIPQERSASSHRAVPESAQKNEVVCADVSQHALGQR